jgi:predicted CXXCH cytochrome family protein
VVFSRYPYTWEGGTRTTNPGGSHINSGEARDFLLGACASELSCTRCHDPHAEDAKRLLSALEGPEGNALCTSCHPNLASETALRKHSHHPAGSAGSFCINCHMPRKNMGLDYNLTRYHRIGSPTDRERVEHDRPLECALCHADRSVEQIVLTMERLWNKRYDRKALHRLYGADLGINGIRAALLGGKAHEQAVGVAVAGERRSVDLLPAVVLQLDNPYPLVRFFATQAIERITARKLAVDLHAPGPKLLEQARRELAAHAPRVQ